MLVLAVGLILVCQEPLDALVVAPLDVLADLVAHEVELGAGVGHLIEGQGAKAGELAPLVARLAHDEGGLAVHHLVMGQRHDVVLREGVHHGEGEQLVVARTPGEVGLAVIEGVVHPAHIPLVVEAQAAYLGGTSYQGPGGGLLGHHHGVGVVLAHGLVDVADEVDGLEVFLGALVVELLLAGVVHAKVEIEHGGHAVDADAVCVVGLEPEEGVGGEEGAHLAARVIELVGAPVGVLFLLVEVVAVEVHQALDVAAEAAGHPVQDDADVCLVALVHEVHEGRRVAIARGRRIVAGGLIAPGAVEGVLHDGHELDVGVTHVAHIVH